MKGVSGGILSGFRPEGIADNRTAAGNFQKMNVFQYGKLVVFCIVSHLGNVVDQISKDATTFCNYSADIHPRTVFFLCRKHLDPLELLDTCAGESLRLVIVHRPSPWPPGPFTYIHGSV